MESVLAGVPKAAADPERPVYHFHPPCNWNNDPNGTIFYQGWHHLFYQLNPYGSLWGNMHWGHARSRDLVNWEHLPVALWPTGKEEAHIFSGGAVIAADGRPRVFYTSIGRTQPEQWLAAPTDGELIGWEKPGFNPVLTQSAHGARPVSEWRDPFLFREAGQTYMVCGGNVSRAREGGAAQVQLYRAENDEMSRWRHLGAVFEYRDRETHNIECPNLFKLGGKWVLIISPHRPCEYFVGDLDLTRARFTPDTHGVLDAGDAYASNISVDDKGRTILWLWGRTNLTADRGWNSVMTIPRILSIGSDGFLRQQPAPEFASLRGEMKTLAAEPLGSEPRLVDGGSGDTLEVEAEFAGGATAFGFEVRRSADGKPSAVVSVEGGNLVVGSARTYIGRPARVKLHLFLDKGCLEVYVNDGQAALYSPLAADPKNQGFAVFGRAGRGPDGGARLESCRAWPLKPARFDMERFRL
jgi:beta-fructofuranosidase